MAKYAAYSKDWVANFFHEFPHFDFEFQPTNSSFNPDSKQYREAIVLLAAAPVLWCILILLITTLCLCVQCCKKQPKQKRRTTCLRLITALFIIFAIGSVAVGFFGNEEAAKGVQITEDAVQDTSDTISDAVSILTTVDSLTNNTDRGVQTLEDVIKRRLNGTAIIDEILKIVDDIKSMSGFVKVDINSIKKQVNQIDFNKLIDTAKQVEYNRWVGTIILLCCQILVLLVYIIGTLMKSKCWLVWGIVLGLISLFLVWIAAGVYLGGIVAASDFCVKPDAYVINTVGSGTTAEVVRGYIECKDKRDPMNFSKAYDDALSYVSKANDTLTLAVNRTLPYHIDKDIAGPVRTIRLDLTYAQGNISSLSQVVFCKKLHTNYIKALTGACNNGLVGIALVLVILPILGLSLVFIQCLAPCIWQRIGSKRAGRKDGTMIDDSDPFLPRPPPYHDYGTIRAEERPLNRRSFLDDSTVMPDPHTPPHGSADTPPPAYYPGSFVEQYNNNMGTFPRSRQT